MTAVNKANCRATLLLNEDRVRYFLGRISELGLAVTDWVIVVLNIDSGADAAGLAEALMPGQSARWQGYRDQGMVPFARGLANREGIQDVLDQLDPITGAKLRGIVGAAVLVMDHGVAEVFDVSEDLK